MNVIDKIDNLSAKFNPVRDRQEFSIFSAWKSDAAKALMIKSVAETDAIQMMLKDVDAEIEKIDTKLLTLDSTQLTEKARDRALDAKSMFVWFRSFFKDAESTLARIEKEVDENIKANQKY